MKKIQILILVITLFVGSTKEIFSQKNLSSQTLEKTTTSKEYYKILDNTPGTGMKGTKGFFIKKIERASKKEIFKVELKIPKKTKMYYPISNGASFNLIGDNIVAVYDVAKKKTKNCFIRLINTQTGVLGEDILAFTDKVNSIFNLHEIVFKTFYSPDFSKVAVLKDNISPKNNIDAEINIYDAKTLNLISRKNLGQKYNGTKRIFDLNNITIDNSGNILLAFNLMNEQTKVTTKSYSAKLPAKADELKDIKESNTNNLADGSTQTSQGRFYKNLNDYLNDKPIQGVRIKNGSYRYSVASGNDFKLIDENGNLKNEDAKNLPSDLFTYKREDYMEPLLIRIIDKKPYIVLAAGKISYYVLFLDNQLQYFTEDWDNADLKKFNEGKLEDFLKQYGLLEEYKKTMPKREIDDSVNGWYNKNINHRVEFINKLNKKIKN